MDPVTIIVAALVAGAAAAGKDVAAQAVKDGYAALKALIVRKFGSKADVADAVKAVEKKPASEGRKKTLQEELETAEAGQDAQVVQQAQALLDLLKEHGWPSAPTYHAQAGDDALIAQGPGAVVGGVVAVGGDVEGGVHLGGGTAAIEPQDE